MRVYSIVAKEVESNMIVVVIHIVMMHILQGWCLSEVFGEVGCDIWERGSDSRKPERKTLQDSQSNYGDWVQRQFHFPCEEWILQERFIYFQNNPKLFLDDNPIWIFCMFRTASPHNVSLSQMGQCWAAIGRGGELFRGVRPAVASQVWLPGRKSSFLQCEIF